MNYRTFVRQGGYKLNRNELIKELNKLSDEEFERVFTFLQHIANNQEPLSVSPQAETQKSQ